MKKALFFLVGMSLASILLVSGYWAYFNMRYKVVMVNNVIPVLYDTWTNEWNPIKDKKEPGVIEMRKTEASAPPAPTPVPKQPSVSVKK
ncbi:MAG: hypothetical protein WCJ37_03560 [Syntrophus sp. (in: bacteria)]